MKLHQFSFLSKLVAILLVCIQLLRPSAAYAAGTVGTGTAGSCTEAAFNTALAGGGAIDFDCGGGPVTITITSTKMISNNTQIDGGGLITISGGNSVRIFTVQTGVTLDLQGVTLANGNSGAGNTTDNEGGAIFIESGATAIITNSTFLNNTNAFNSLTGGHSGGGGAIFNAGTLTVTGSTFSGNSSTGPAGDGGAIMSREGAVSISNSTFVGNSATTDLGTGAAIRLHQGAGPNTITHVTISNNANDPDPEHHYGSVDVTETSVTLSYSILANSTSGLDCSKRDGGTVTSTDNLIENGAGCSPATTLDPGLGALQNNGGLTQTIAITTASPAHDFAASCPLSVDQRGLSRPQPSGGNCDLGAFELDGTPPDTSITATPSDPSGSSNAVFTFTGSDPVGFGVASFECQLDAGSFSACTSGSTFGPFSHGSHTFNVRAVDLDGNVDPTPASFTWNVDLLGPTVTINQAAGQPDPTNLGPINFTAVFSESVTDFTEVDVTLGGTSNASTVVVTGSGTTYNVAVSGMSIHGTVTASVNAGAVTDTFGNPSLASTSTDNSVLYDLIGPEVTINQAGAQADPANASPINFTIVFSEPVSNFATGDVTLSGSAGAATAIVTGSGTNYNVAVSGMIGDGTVIASIPAGVATDMFGHENSASTSTDNTVTLDTTAPTVTINQAPSQSDPALLTPINFAVVFSEAVSGFASSDVNLSGTAGATTAVITGGPSSYTVAVSGMTSAGTVIASIPGGAATDAAGNGNPASTSTDNAVLFDPPVPGIPVLARPVSGASIRTNPPLLDWNDSSPIAQYYQVQVSSSNDFLSPLIDETDISTSQFTPSSALVPSQLYYWRVRGFSALGFPGDWSNTESFEIKFSAPGALLAPTAGEHVLELRPTFDWVDATGAQYYTIQVSRNSSFTQIVMTDSSINSVLNPRKDLPPATTLYWHVRADMSNGIGVWSQIFSFTTPNPPSIPQSLSPTHNAILDTTPRLRWSTVSLPHGTTFDHYQVQVATNANFTSPLVDDDLSAVSSTSYSPTGTFTPGTLYFWRVRAFNTGNEVSSWSEVRAFRMQQVINNDRPTIANADATLALPVLFAPVDGSTIDHLRPVLEWNDVAGASGYIIQVSMNPSWESSPFLVFATTVDSRYVVINDLPSGTTLYWRVLAIYGKTVSNWSPVSHFTVP